MAETSTPTPEAIRRTEGPEQGSFFEPPADARPIGRLPEGNVLVARHMLNGQSPDNEYQQELVEIASIPGDGSFRVAGPELQAFIHAHRRRLVTAFEKIPVTIAGERFRISQVREPDGIPGALTKRLKEAYGLPDFWVKAEPWPFPAAFREPPDVIDTRAVAESLGCDVVYYRDPCAPDHRQPPDLILVPVFPPTAGR